jgi:c-di-GMP-binding flagellar brake protein YcgR
MFDDNRRKYPRVNYPCQLTMWLTEGNNETVLANTANIGLGGLCVYLNQGISVGTKVDIQLNFTDTTTPFKCRGSVVRCLQESEKFYNIGIQFEPLSELKTAFLDGKISELIALEKKAKS